MDKKEKKVMSQESVELSDKNADDVAGGLKLGKFHADFKDGQFTAGMESTPDSPLVSDLKKDAKKYWDYGKGLLGKK